MTRKEDIKVIVINKPTKEESERKTKELCAFLEQMWTMPSKGE